jgi:hypothetical protein
MGVEYLPATEIDHTILKENKEVSDNICLKKPINNPVGFFVMENGKITDYITKKQMDAINEK